ncbi:MULTISPECIES: hypothetical protein [Klebsiella]|uniref:Uncharacterized protein n=2 Tax=Klebsiella TaxID=570 RepID=A0ABT6EGV2_9ENTR|nr:MULTISPECIES: hypothetical protein [Klebsiella]MBA7932925.1 hypothetical protein [Klebsiella sp. RHBSTW-00215]MBA7934073.1 hypothetical protein [Klebsiella sp. RHBSTW-00215]MDG1642962.1 hypothetical protein [Klebsiella huaxiensis]VUS37678.1 hypothetical protein SB6408_03233 [Klebsiella spallanzanii]
MKKASEISPETRNFRIAQLINQKISQPVCDVTIALVLAGKTESEITEAAEITARVILKTLSNHLEKGDRTLRCEGE